VAKTKARAARRTSKTLKGARSAAAPWRAGFLVRLNTTTNGESFRSIGHRTGADRETVRRYMRSGVPGVGFIREFCSVYGVSADWLLGLDKKAKKAKK
jgi:hypothetical protein